MTIKFEDLKKVEIDKKVYAFFKANADAFKGVEITNTGASKNSYSFVRKDGESRKECIARVFNIDSLPERIDSRALVLHSSALTALLCFHKISDTTPLYLTIEGTEHKFCSVEFEHPNKCLEGGCSMIDVALYDTINRTVLYLECKFSEYLESSCSSISSAYACYYEDFKSDNILPDCLEFKGLEEGSEEIKICSKTPRQPHYKEGIKQMLSHYIGAKNSTDHNIHKYRIFIGTVLFDFCKNNLVKDSDREYFSCRLEDYKELYGSLADNLNKIADDGISLLPEVLTYQELFSGKNTSLLVDKVKDYYSFG